MSSQIVAISLDPTIIRNPIFNLHRNLYIQFNVATGLNERPINLNYFNFLVHTRGLRNV